MRRAAAAPLVVALLVIGSCVPASAAGVPGARESGECTWAKHSKRVWKKVHRQGRALRVRRTKVWWTCVPIAAPTAPTATPPPLATPEPEPQPESVLGHLGVKAKEWSYTLSRPEVAAGEVAIQLQNQGGDPHDLNIAPEGSDEPIGRIPVAPPEGQASETFDLAPGTYRLWCDLPEHDEQGMHAQLVVAAASGS